MGVRPSALPIQIPSVTAVRVSRYRTLLISVLPSVLAGSGARMIYVPTLRPVSASARVSVPIAAAAYALNAAADPPGNIHRIILFFSISASFGFFGPDL